jgi:branched-chain amino acid transport system permease protein
VSIFWVGRSASVDPLSGGAPLLIAFIATVIGGMNSLTGAVLGGFIYGLLFNLLSILLPASLINYRDAFMFLIVIMFLLLRPEGLIKGNYVEERVG